ncbi:hypothetical protein Fot_56630 [Forsythia ovata]|uniref:Uncharacterized protein n=1 Tax=Forsythia ovata TaxID=205694 RepID=A0ABD1NZ37_9LAMI
MGLSASKRVELALHNSPEFNAASDSIYTQCLSQAQHAFPGVKPFQLFSATVYLHQTLFRSLPLISKRVPHPPNRDQVDRAYKTVISRLSVQQDKRDESVLDEVEFKAFAVEVFTNAVVSNAGDEVLKLVPLGVAGIAGVGLILKPGKEVIGAAVGAYALGVATSIYLSLADFRIVELRQDPKHA